MNKRALSRKNYILILCIIFAVSSLFRFVIGDFLKTILIYPDELRYFMIGENLATGRGLKLFNAPVNFQKILYSLFLVPAFLVKDRRLTLHLIAFINAVLMSCGVFPVATLAKKVSGSRKWGVVCAVCYVFLAEMTYTSTFMSEVVYIPLGITLVYALVCYFDRCAQPTTPPPEHDFCLPAGWASSPMRCTLIRR